MNDTYQIGIVGGGLAGLSLAIQMADLGIDVCLLEKKKFPFHKLCGEYLSLESIPFLEYIGVDINSLGAPEINRLAITTPQGSTLEEKLGLGAIGISRYTLDNELFKIAINKGVKVLENTLVSDILQIDNQHVIKSNKGLFYCQIVVSAHGKQSKLNQLNKDNNSTNSYLGIKYHGRLKDYPDDLISIHNFNNGYCGVCRIENEGISICYLSHTENLSFAGNKIKRMEEEILFKNQNIEVLFKSVTFDNKKPIAVSNINFSPKSLIVNGIFFCGDSAGLIAPLCGNGMSIALHSSYILAGLLNKYFFNKINRHELEDQYKTIWNSKFRKRLKAGRAIQKIVKHKYAAHIGLQSLKVFPYFNQKIIALTHGQNFMNL